MLIVRVESIPFLPCNLHHSRTLVDKSQTLYPFQIIILSVPARAHAHLQHVTLGLFNQTASKTVNAPDVFRGGDISVKVFGSAMVAICNVCVLRREWMVWFCQEREVEVETISSEGVDG